MIVTNEVLKQKFEKGEETNNWEDFFREVNKITSYTVCNKFSNLKDKQDLIQECNLSVWRQILNKKINKNSNMFSYIMGRASFRARDEVRKTNRRDNKAKIIPMENEEIFNYLDRKYHYESKGEEI